MPGRDPNTGQFTSGGGPTGVSYRDHEAQHVRATFRDNGAGANAAYSIQDVVEIEPPGDRREEEAELVALIVHTMRAEIDQTNVADPEAARIGFEITRDDDIGPLTQFRTEVDLAGNAIESTSITSADTALSRQIVLDDMDPLFFALLRCASGNSVVNAYGGPWIYDYRRMLGGGPVFTGGDEVHVHGRLNNVENGSNQVGDMMFSMYWDVRDRD